MVVSQHEVNMSKFYMKNSRGEFLPVELKSIINKDLNDRLVIVRVGNDDQPASMDDLDETEESFANADVLNELNNVSVIITPYQIDIDAVKNESIEDKSIYVQISSGDDISALEERAKQIYRRLSKKFDSVILPTPLKIKDYRQVKDTLKRCEIRRERRTKSRF
jgi:hypothetical protein